jgi:hypothetical protein
MLHRLIAYGANLITGKAQVIDPCGESIPCLLRNTNHEELPQMGVIGIMS